MDAGETIGAAEFKTRCLEILDSGLRASRPRRRDPLLRPNYLGNGSQRLPNKQRCCPRAK